MDQSHSQTDSSDILTISSADSEAKEVLKKLAETDPRNISIAPQDKLNGGDALTLIVENYLNLAAGTSMLIATLKGMSVKLVVHKNKMELKLGKKEDALNDIREK